MKGQGAQKSKAMIDTDLEAFGESITDRSERLHSQSCRSRRGLCTGWCNKVNSCHRVRERFDNRLAAYQSLSNEFHALNKQVNAGIELLKTKIKK